MSSPEEQVAGPPSKDECERLAVEVASIGDRISSASSGLGNIFITSLASLIAGFISGVAAEMLKDLSSIFFGFIVFILGFISAIVIHSYRPPRMLIDLVEYTSAFFSDSYFSRYEDLLKECEKSYCEESSPSTFCLRIRYVLHVLIKSLKRKSIKRRMWELLKGP